MKKIFKTNFTSTASFPASIFSLFSTIRLTALTFLTAVTLLVTSLSTSFAQEAKINTGAFRDFANSFTTDVIATLGTMFMAAAFMFFSYGVALYIYHRASGSGDLKKDQDFMIWGLAGLFVMVSVWGIVRLGQSLLGDNFARTNGVALDAVRFNVVGGGGSGASQADSTKREPIDPTKREPIDPTKREPIDPTKREPIDPTKRGSSTPPSGNKTSGSGNNSNASHISTTRKWSTDMGSYADSGNSNSSYMDSLRQMARQDTLERDQTACLRFGGAWDKNGEICDCNGGKCDIKSFKEYDIPFKNGDVEPTQSCDPMTSYCQ